MYLTGNISALADLLLMANSTILDTAEYYTRLIQRTETYFGHMVEAEKVTVLTQDYKHLGVFTQLT